MKPLATLPPEAPTRIETVRHDGYAPTVLEEFKQDIEAGVQVAQDWIDNARYEFNHPGQVKRKHRKLVRTFGQIGWVGKGVLYATMGGLACKGAARGSNDDSSPQGAFVVFGSGKNGVAPLIIFAVVIALYVIWRFWEGITGQGFDENLPSWKNFFKFRLSPLVSGCVYTSYLIFIISLIFNRNEDGSKSFPAGWSKTTIGQIGLGLLGIAFIAACIVQLVTAFRRDFHSDYRIDIPQKARLFILTIGHVGYLGRAAFFLALAVYFFKDINQHLEPTPGHSALSQGLGQLQKTTWGRVILFIIGMWLIVYGAFAVLSAYGRYFPTPPPSRIKKHRVDKFGDIHMESRPRTSPLGHIEITPQN